MLVVRDRGGAVFGCFTAEAWRVAPRYYGTGESFVFQLQVCCEKASCVALFVRCSAQPQALRGVCKRSRHVVWWPPARRGGRDITANDALRITVYMSHMASAAAPVARASMGEETVQPALTAPACAQPRAALWRWHQRRMRVARNDFFQFGRPECVALGGAPRYALCLDSDLAFGSSGPSETFGSPCLASGEEFGVGRVELWSLA